MKSLFAASAVLALAIALSGCSSAPADTYADAGPSPAPCIDPPELVAAVETIWSARSNPSPDVYGEVGGRRSNLLELLKHGNLAAIDNPKGEGVIVSVVYAGGKAFARDTAYRTGWLVLDGVIYPINVDAAQAFGMLWDGYPPAAQAAAGLGEDYFDFDSYGIEGFVAYNADTVADLSLFLQAANGLCATPTGLGS